MRHIFPALLACAVAVATPAAAHDFWIQPLAGPVVPGARAAIHLEVGHGADRERWGGGRERLVALQSIAPDGVATDRRAQFVPGGARPHLMLGLTQPGVHMLAITTNDAVSDLPAVRFNDYAKTEGLTPALTLRERAGRSNTPGRELYSRRAKTLIQVGPPGPAARAVTRPLGLTLEIVPERDPHALGRDRRLPVRVLWQGRPLAGALVKLTRLESDEKPVAETRTDRAGRARFTVPPAGSWALNVLWTKPIDDPRAEFQTVFSNLSFAYPAR